MRRWAVCVLAAVVGCACVTRQAADAPSEVAGAFSLANLAKQHERFLDRGARSVQWSGGYDHTLGLYETEQQSTVKVLAGGEVAFWDAIQEGRRTRG
jgi:hypothetical protein